MRRAIKYLASDILRNNLTYSTTNSVSNKKIAAILFTEQKGFCAYTEEYLTRTDAKDIDHFNPSIKNTPQDGYNNWYLVKHQWNKEKSKKWATFQPILNPLSDDFEERVIYYDGDYLPVSETDIEAKNLISLLKLSDPALSEKRKRYIKRKREEITLLGLDAQNYFLTLLNDVELISYLRAIKEEFNVDIWNMLP